MVHGNLVLKLQNQHNNILNPEFAEIITRNLFRHKEEISASDFNEYIVLIDEHLCNPYDLYSMTEIAMDKNLACLGWNLFSKLFKYQIKASEKILSLCVIGICVVSSGSFWFNASSVCLSLPTI